MKTISRYIMTLALLLTAVGGAWAQDAEYIIHVDFYGNYIPDETRFICEIRNMTDPDAEIKGTLELSVDGDLKGSFPVNGDMFMGNIDPVDAGDHTWSAVFKPEGGGEFSRDGHFTINKVKPTIFNESSTSINLGVGESTEVEVYVLPDEAGELSYSLSDASVASITKKEYSYKYIIEAKAEGTATITFSCAGNKNYDAAEDVKFTVTVSTPPIDVTTNAAEEGATFTEASFEMPTSDVTVNYELVRDMTVDMTVTVQDADKNSRFRVQNQGNSFEPVGLTNEQVMALFTVHDDIESKDLTAITDYTVQIFAADDNDQPTGTAMTFSNFTYAPGKYVVKAVAAEGSNYSGTTEKSNVFELFQGYEVEVPAGEYITYYKDEALKVEDTESKLYTITAVSGATATADELTIAPANTPILVKNNGSETKTILLIPTTTDTPDNVTPYEGFTGTLEAATIAASTTTQNNYAFNGKEFVWVKDALNIAANKAWLSISGPSNTRSISIVFDSETTGINGVSSTVETGDGNWYDLNGRKFTTKPTKKGVYIMNGKKVVIKN